MKRWVVRAIVVVAIVAAFSAEVASGAMVPVTVTIDSVTNISAGDTFDGPDFFSEISINDQPFVRPLFSISNTAVVIAPGWTATQSVSTRRSRIPIRIEIWDDDSPGANQLVDVDPAVCTSGGPFGTGCAIVTVGRPAIDFAGLDLDFDPLTGVVTPVDPSGDASAASTCATGTEAIRATVCFTITVGAATTAEGLRVTKTTDTNDHACTLTDCSLREAIDRAGPGDTIILPSSSAPYRLTDPLTSGHLRIDKTVTIVGPSDGGAAIIEQTMPFRVFDVGASGNLTLSNVTIRGGEASDTSTAFSGHLHGGGIHNHGTVTLTNVTITGNTAHTTTVDPFHSDPGISARGGGGGIYNATNASLTMTNVTIVGNDASDARGLGLPEGGGIAGPGTIRAKNVLVVDNTGRAGNCNDSPIDDGGNAQFPGSSCGAGFWLAPARPIGSIFVDGTFPLLPGSPVIDHGTNTGCPSSDQVGVPRPIDGDGDGTAVCDPGAAEYDPLGLGVVQQPLDSATVQPGPVTLTFQNVLAAGFATLVMPTTGPAPPNGYQHGTPARYYDLMTTSLYSGSIKVCIDYAGIAFANEATLRLFHHSSTGWEDKTSSLDMSTKTICAAVTSLSPFAIFEQAPPDTTPPTITPTVTGTLGANGWYTSNVQLTWTVAEPDSPATLRKTGCADQAIASDQQTTSYTCEASSDGGTATPVTVTIKRDATAPTLSFSGNAGTYTVAQTININCSASDNLSGIATTCAGVNGPAYTFPLGANSVTRSASDNAGNTGTATTSFTVVVNSQSLCALTSQFVQASPKYQALSPAAKRVVDAIVSAACAYLTNIGPATRPDQKTKFIKAYKDAAQALARNGWLTQAQATTLSKLADGL